MDGYMPGGLDRQPHLVATDLDDSDDDVVVDDEALVFLTADHDHGAASLRDGPGGTVDLLRRVGGYWSGWTRSSLVAPSRARSISRGARHPDGGDGERRH